MTFAARLILTASFAALAAAPALAQPAPVPYLQLSKARTTGCSNCSRTATTRASSATRCRRCSAAIIAMPTVSATCSATLTTKARRPRHSKISRRSGAIARGDLNAADQLAYDVFDYQTRDTLRGLQPELAALNEALPMNHFFGLHTEYPTISSGQGGAPYATVLDYENSPEARPRLCCQHRRGHSSMAQGRKRRVSSTPS